MVACGGCGSAVASEGALHAAHQLWHEGHFRCRSCQRAILEDEQYALIDGGRNQVPESGPRALCRRCFEQRSAVKCSGCNRGIVSTQFVEADGRSWHSYCFVCSFCQKEVTSSYTHDEDSRPLHYGCFIDRALRATIVDEGARLQI